MRHPVRMLLLVLVAVMSLTVLSRAQRRDVWEHEIAFDVSKVALRDLGREGWEVAAATTDSQGVTRVILKRRAN